MHEAIRAKGWSPFEHMVATGSLAPWKRGRPWRANLPDPWDSFWVRVVSRRDVVREPVTMSAWPLEHGSGRGNRYPWYHSLLVGAVVDNRPLASLSERPTAD